jgi:conjugative transfer pilus assembly protein TraH
MKHRVRRAIGNILAITTAFCSSICSAGWVDDWFSNASVTGPSSYNNQQRGFYSAGGFQARINNTNDYLVTASLPKLKSGCGGVDLFMGGISFLDIWSRSFRG